MSKLTHFSPVVGSSLVLERNKDCHNRFEDSVIFVVVGGGGGYEK